MSTLSLLREFEILEGISKDSFNEKDWSRFARFAEHREKENVQIVATVFDAQRKTILCDKRKSIQELYSEAVDKWTSQEYRTFFFPFERKNGNISCKYVIEFIEEC